jgi:dipeptidyl aminopeptidase/acylaminoacyl peptidase
MKIFLYLLMVCQFYFNYSFGQTKCDTLIFNSNGSNIWGYFYVSTETNSPPLIFIQALFETGDIWNIGKTLAQNGINVFMFDFRGCFKSEGKQGLMNSQQDISAALAFLNTKKIIKNYNIDTSNIILGGYSYGGHMSMLYAVYNSKVNKVLNISGGDLGILGDEFEYDKPINELMENQNYFYILKHIQELANTDVFMTGGLDDQTVSLEKMVLPLYRALKKNKNKEVECNVYQTDHSYSNVRSKLLDDIINWIKRKRI